MRARRRTTATAAAAAAALSTATLLLGCSGGTSDAKAQLVKEATKVCDESADAIEVASAQLTPQSTAEQVSAFLAQTLVPLYRKRLDALRALRVPDSDRGTYDALLDEQRKVVDAIEADPATYTASANDPFSAVDARWDAYGVTACGSRSALPSSS